MSINAMLFAARDFENDRARSPSRPYLMIAPGFLSVVAISFTLVLSPTSSSTATASKSPNLTAAASDPYLWLEDINGEKALAWVREHDARTFERLKSQPTFDKLYRDALAVLDSSSRIPEVHQMGKFLSSGYPRLVKIWKRGEGLANDGALYEAKSSSVRAGARISRIGEQS